MDRTGGSRTRVALPPWLVAVLALTVVALLHGVQCATATGVPLLAAAASDQVPAHAVTSAESSRAALPAEAGTGTGSGHGELPCGPGLAAGACLMLLASAAVGLLARGRSGWSYRLADELRRLIAITRRRRSPDLTQLCVLRT